MPFYVILRRVRDNNNVFNICFYYNLVIVKQEGSTSLDPFSSYIVIFSSFCSACANVYFFFELSLSLFVSRCLFPCTLHTILYALIRIYSDKSQQFIYTNVCFEMNLMVFLFFFFWKNKKLSFYIYLHFICIYILCIWFVRIFSVLLVIVLFRFIQHYYIFVSFDSITSDVLHVCNCA